MKTKNQKIEEWCREMGYQTTANTTIAAVTFLHCVEIFVSTPINDVVKNSKRLLGIFTPDGIYHAMPQFEDDKPEPRDKALQKYYDQRKHSFAPEYLYALTELNSRLLALEAKVLDEK